MAAQGTAARFDKTTILKILVSAAVLLALALLVDFSALESALLRVTVLGVLLVLALIPVSMGLRALRLWLLLGRSISFGAATRITLVGETLNIFLPASAGDIAKAYYGVREHGRKEEMVTATLIDKAAGLLGLLILGAVAALVHGYTVLGIGFAVAAIVGGVFYLVPGTVPWSLLNKLAQRVKRDAIDIKQVRVAFSEQPQRKYLALLVSIGAWLVSYLHLFLIARLFGANLSPWFLVSVAPLINLSRLVPFAFAGLGVQEGVTASLFSLAGIPASLSIVVSLAFTLCVTILPGLVGLYYFAKMKRS